MQTNSPCVAITTYLQEWRAGNASALDLLTTAIYDELRRVAAGVLAGNDRSRTIRPTVLVHELYLRLPGVQNLDWASRGQFLNVAARMMRNIVVDYARSQQALKRGGAKVHVALAEVPSPVAAKAHLDVLVINELLDQFGTDYPRAARVVELRYFGGLSEQETSTALQAAGFESSTRTVVRDWTFAKAWLQRRLAMQ